MDHRGKKDTVQPPLHAFSRGRPAGHVFQLVSTAPAPPPERYDYWVETQLRQIRMARADTRQRRDFRARLVSLSTASHEMHYSHSDGFRGGRTLADIRAGATDEISLLYVMQGRYDGLVDGRPVRAAAGEFFLYDPLRPQELRVSDHRLIEVDLSRRSVAALFNGRVPAPWTVNEALRQSPLTNLLRLHLNQFPRLAPRLGSDEQVALLRATSAFTLEILRGACAGRMNAAGGHKDELFLAARHYIDSRLEQPSLGAGEIAAFLGCSRATLYRVFAEQGEGVAAYIREQRLQRFRRLLEDPLDRRPLWAVAQGCGLYDASNLSQMFKRRFGCSPRDVRAQACAGKPGALPAGARRLETN